MKSCLFLQVKPLEVGGIVETFFGFMRSLSFELGFCGYSRRFGMRNGGFGKFGDDMFPTVWDEF